MRLVLGAAAIGLVGIGWLFAWSFDHAAIPALIALAEVLK